MAPAPRVAGGRRAGMSVVDDVRARLDIVDVVSDHVALQKAGRNYKALCPFHDEKTPSFVVNPERQSWRCFGACATGGDVFSFVMRIEGLEFGEALKRLAEKTGVALQRRHDGDRNDGLYRINQEAARFYQGVLESAEGRRGVDYLSERGVDRSARSAFQLGLSPKGRDRLKSHLFSLGFGLEQAVEAGLLRRNDDGSVRDFFWGRLMFPIHDRQGRVAGFGGRSLDGSNPKYLNTASTPVFDKRATLYGLHLALESIRKQETAVIVEGYMDTIAAHQHGYTNVVASMGTALTQQQVSQIGSTVKSFVLALDPDAAGQEATLRSLESTYRVLESQPLGRKRLFDLKVAALPTGLDPAELIRQDPKEWERLVREAVDFMDFYIPAQASRYDLSSSNGKEQAAQAIGPTIMSTRNAFEQDRSFSLLAKTLDVSRDLLEASIGRPGRGRNGGTGRRSSRERERATGVSPLSDAQRDPIEELILAIVLQWPELGESARAHEPDEFQRPDNREVFACWRSCNTMEELRDRLDETLQDHLVYLSQKDLSPTDRRSAVLDLTQSLKRLEQRYWRGYQEELLSSANAGLPPPRELEGPIVSANARIRGSCSQRN